MFGGRSSPPRKGGSEGYVFTWSDVVFSSAAQALVRPLSRGLASLRRGEERTASDDAYLAELAGERAQRHFFFVRQKFLEPRYGLNTYRD